MFRVCAPRLSGVPQSLKHATRGEVELEEGIATKYPSADSYANRPVRKWEYLLKLMINSITHEFPNFIQRARLGIVSGLSSPKSQVENLALVWYEHICGNMGQY